MAAEPLPPVPQHLASDPIFFRWLEDLHRIFKSGVAEIDAGYLDFSGVSLSQLGDRSHSYLTNILPADPAGSDVARDKHTSDQDLTIVYANQTRIGILEAAPSAPVAATPTVLGTVLEGAAVAAVAATDAPAAAAIYTQADIDTMVTVINETKAQLNALLTSLQASGAII